ncbi:sporulation protein [Ideonella sp. A 288]|uniref:sporulation protein n=1 Tax=Ideonella sp. A 288 TaxID=1962181 RepID=UPI000B4ADDCD|nr:sporulation protein [Ideonella sp. A 288]
MLRALVLLLLLVNGLLLAWQQGWLGAAAPAPSMAQREPERVRQQVNPEAVRVLPPVAASAALADAARRAAEAAAMAASAAASGAAAAASAPASAASGVSAAACLEAGPFATAELPAVERALREAQLPPRSWTTVSSQRKGSFMVYMGRYADADAVTRKLEELQRLKVEAEALGHSPELQPGVSLGRFDDKGAADNALARLVQRGVRTARVVTITPTVTLATLRVPAADAALRDKLFNLKLLPAGVGFAPCAATPPKA